MKATTGRRTQIATVLCLLAAGMMAVPTMAAPAERYLHVNVEGPTKGESVNVNVTLAMAEEILPAIHNEDLHNGMVSIHNAKMNGVDLRAILDAVRTAPDNEFVTVKRKDADVRVAKSNGNIIVRVTDNTDRQQKVDVTVPLKIIDALLATANNGQLNVAAALRALNDAGDVTLVTVRKPDQKVRVWVDSRSTQD
ncbi:MAG: hypothetical protein ACRD4X_00065 [Candidatus Acidiferrales bacterium]